MHHKQVERQLLFALPPDHCSSPAFGHRMSRSDLVLCQSSCDTGMLVAASSLKALPNSHTCVSSCAASPLGITLRPHLNELSCGLCRLSWRLCVACGQQSCLGASADETLTTVHCDRTARRVATWVAAHARTCRQQAQAPCWACTAPCPRTASAPGWWPSCGASPCG